jgi:hypothetical protein
MFEELTFTQIMIFTGVVSIILTIFLWYLKKIFARAENFDLNIKNGILSGLPDINLKSSKNQQQTQEQKNEAKRRFISDVSFIIKEVVEYENRKQYLDLKERFETQLNSAKDYIERERGILRKEFFDLLEKRLAASGEDTGNIASNNDFIIYEAILNFTYYEVYNIIRDVVHEEEFIYTDINSIAFKEYIDNKIQGIINKEHDILNKYYVCYKYLSRTDVYKFYREKETCVKNILRNMFYDMKQNSDLYEKEVNNITKKINDYLINYFKRGISSCVE